MRDHLQGSKENVEDRFASCTASATENPRAGKRCMPQGHVGLEVGELGFQHQRLELRPHERCPCTERLGEDELSVRTRPYGDQAPIAQRLERVGELDDGGDRLRAAGLRVGWRAGDQRGSAFVAPGCCSSRVSRRSPESPGYAPAPAMTRLPFGSTTWVRRR